MTFKKEKINIGLLFDSFSDDYDEKIYLSILEAAEDDGNVNLISFVGGALFSRFTINRSRNIIYDLINSDDLDGLISVSGSIGNFVEIDILKKFLERFKNIPIMSIGTAIRNIHSIVVDNKKGLYDLFVHLIEHHKFKKIAFIKGMSGNSDADERFEIYKNVLEKYQIPFNEKLVALGDFCRDSGSAAVSYFLDKMKVKFDVIVGANDYMAIEAMKELLKRGYNVPYDVAVCGFDDIEDARCLMYPLTTVRQPVYSLGKEAFKTLIKIINSEKVKNKKIIPTEAVIRRSCGCYITEHLEKISNKSKLFFNELLSENIKKIFFKKFKNLIDDNYIKDWSQNFVNGLSSSFSFFSSKIFMYSFEELVMVSMKKNIDVLIWIELITNIFYKIKNSLTEPEEIEFIENLWKDILILIGNTAANKQTFFKVQLLEDSVKLHSIGESLITIFNYNKIIDVVKQQFPKLGINSCYVYRYTNEKRDRARLVTYYDRKKNKNEKVEEDIICSSILKVLKESGGIKNYIIMGLFFEEEQLGFAVFESGANDPMTYETLSIQLSSAIKGAGLIEKVKNHSVELEKKVKERTLELFESNEKLKLVINEHKITSNKLIKKNIEIEKLNKILERKSKTDSLTNLYNRDAFFKLLELEINRTLRNIWRIKANKSVMNSMGKQEVDFNFKNKPSGKITDHFGIFSIMMIDIDYFKKINDTHGHLIGDKVLKKLGKLFMDSEILRNEDIVGRFGGEEFIVILPNTNTYNSLGPALRLTGELDKIEFNGVNNTKFKVTLSIGISQFDPKDKNNDSVVQRADEAMYYAKKHGRNQIVIYEEAFRK